jgi:hypothetical protein
MCELRGQGSSGRTRRADVRIAADKASSWWRWCKQHCGKLIFHPIRRLRSRRRWLVRLGS